MSRFQRYPDGPKPANPGRARRKQGPWVIIEVPNDDVDLLYPSKRRFYARDAERHQSVEHVEQALKFSDLKEALHRANYLMHRSRNIWAEPIHFAAAWAIVHGSTATWTTNFTPIIKEPTTP